MHIVLAHQRQGHGTRVLTALIKWYFESTTAELTVGVPRKKEFYRKMGFNFSFPLKSYQLDTNKWEVFYAHSLARSLTRSLTRSLAHSLALSLARSLLLLIFVLLLRLLLCAPQYG
jgi:GNAT superfamily N-acetyltransferase